VAGERVIGVDLGGSKLLAGAVDPDWGVHHRSVRPVVGVGQGELLASCVAAVEEAVEAAGGEVVGVGFGIPALVDRPRGVAISSNHLPLAGVRFADIMGERIGLPVWIDNDANLAALAESGQGAAAGARDAVVLTLGTGIGGGLILGGELYRGASGGAAELGHMTVQADGPPCPGACPNHGCLEAMASGIALAREGARLGLSGAPGEPLTGAQVTELAHDGNAAAGEAVRVVGTWLGVGIAALLNAFDPEVVVVGGGVIAAGELLLGPARAEAARRALPARSAVPIRAARFGQEAGLLGAAALAWEGLAAP